MVRNPLCALALCLVLTGCDACLERAWSRGNSGAFERYAQRAVPKGPLPSNTENVKLDALAVDPSGERICIELQFPFG